MLQKDKGNQGWIKTACNTLKNFVDDIGDQLQYVLKDSEHVGRITATLLNSPDQQVKKTASHLLNKLVVVCLQVCGLETSPAQAELKIDAAQAQLLGQLTEQLVGTDRVLQINSRSFSSSRVITTLESLLCPQFSLKGRPRGLC